MLQCMAGKLSALFMHIALSSSPRFRIPLASTEVVLLFVRVHTRAVNRAAELDVERAIAHAEKILKHHGLWWSSSSKYILINILQDDLVAWHENSSDFGAADAAGLVGSRLRKLHALMHACWSNTSVLLRTVAFSAEPPQSSHFRGKGANVWHQSILLSTRFYIQRPGHTSMFFDYNHLAHGRADLSSRIEPEGDTTDLDFAYADSLLGILTRMKSCHPCAERQHTALRDEEHHAKTFADTKHSNRWVKIFSPATTDQLRCGERVCIGVVQLLSDEAAFRQAFSRFHNDHVNGLTLAKLERRGQKAYVTNIFQDGTVSCFFGRFDLTVLRFPIEAVAMQVQLGSFDYNFFQTGSNPHETGVRFQTEWNGLPGVVQCLLPLSSSVPVLIGLSPRNEEQQRSFPHQFFWPTSALPTFCFWFFPSVAFKPRA